MFKMCYSESKTQESESIEVFRKWIGYKKLTYHRKIILKKRMFKHLRMHSVSYLLYQIQSSPLEIKW